MDSKVKGGYVFPDLRVGGVYSSRSSQSVRFASSPSASTESSAQGSPASSLQVAINDCTREPLHSSS